MFQRTIIAAAFLGLAACSEAPSTSPVGGMAALEACQRADVQDSVGKEARSIFLKNAASGLVVPAMLRLVDLDALAKEVEDADVSFSGIALQSGASADLRTIACSGNFKFDASSAITGQDVVQINHLRWTIRFADDRPDPTSSNFTIEVDTASLYEKMYLNGEPVQSIVARQAREEAKRGERNQTAEAESDQAPSPATSSMAEGELAPEANARKQPSPEELYAPEL